MRNHAKDAFVIIPAFRVAQQVIGVTTDCLNYCHKVIVVDDACPENSGRLVEKEFENDPRVEVIYHETNRGVGAATKTGWMAGFQQGHAFGVKVDGDGQIMPSLVPEILTLLAADSGFAKGNRFVSPEKLEKMPMIRLVGNAGLSLMSKFSSGYWELNDPTNGFIAITRSTFERLSLEKVADDYFFECDLLFRLGLIGVRVAELPMTARYEGENSSLRPVKVIPRFLMGHAVNGFKRLVYEYFVKEWNVGTINLVFGLPLFLFGCVLGIRIWLESYGSASATPTGTLFLSAVPFILGVQLIVAFLNYDVGKRRY